MLTRQSRWTRKSRMKQKTRRRRLMAESLESRRLLAASMGWDGPGQGSAELSYYIEGVAPGLSAAETVQALETALDAWASVVDVTFTPTSTAGLRDSIDISFAAIDGNGGTLAQAYFPDDVNPPRIAGDIQFDIAENWEIGNEQGNAAFDLVWVAVHEIGHSLGLEHSDDFGAVLSESVSPAQAFTELGDSDIDEILQLYAPAVTETPSEDDVTDPDVDEDPDVIIDHGGLIDPTDPADDETDDESDVDSGTDDESDGDSGTDDTPTNDGDDQADDDETDGDETDGDETDGDETDGDETDGDETDGDETDGTDESDTPDDGNTDAGDDMADDDETDADDLPSALSDAAINRLTRINTDTLFETYDADGDGFLAESEVPTRLWTHLFDAQADADGDTVLSSEEISSLVAMLRQNRFDTLDSDGDGTLTEDELSRRQWRRLSAADADLDATISFDEFDQWMDDRGSDTGAKSARFGFGPMFTRMILDTMLNMFRQVLSFAMRPSGFGNGFNSFFRI
ncbi:Matrixin [Crateriforma conspicua]|uniref:Matrixin n=2 Tax=Crateriforma conspicua TaxID=2527996 RepID=A0A5C5Y1I2_9PLAN|nr:Matrixin [Crateriforma conspicua]